MATTQIPIRETNVIPLRVAHTTKGRARLVVDASPNQAVAVLRRVSEHLATLPDVQSIEQRPRSRSIIIEFSQGAWSKLEQEIAAGKDFSLQDPNAAFDAKPRPSAVVGTTLCTLWRHLDQSILRLSGRRLDLTLITGTALVFGALRQVQKGKLLPAGLTLVFQALSLHTEKHEPGADQ